MEIFLTSSPYAPDEKSFIQNDFTEKLKAVWKSGRVLYIASTPDEYEITDSYSERHRNIFVSEGFEISDWTVLDRRNEARAGELVGGADLIILTGGHCLTEHKFFMDINLKELLKTYNGIVMGISAGTMNSARLVYAPPEYDEEAQNPDYVDNYEGLGLTAKNVFPHYSAIRGEIIGGKRMFEDILLPDSYKRDIYCFSDGTYIHIKDGSEEICGSYELLRNGRVYKDGRE